VRDLRGGRRDKEAGAGRDSAIPEDFGGDVHIAAKHFGVSRRTISRQLSV